MALYISTIDQKASTKFLSTRRLALISCFAALYAVLRVLPSFPMIGVTGASFAAADIIAPLYGVILGPIVGPLSIIFGTFLGFLGRPVIFLGLDFLPAAMNALVLGLLMRRKWLMSVAIYTGILLLFVIHPFTTQLVTISTFYFPFHWMHFIALIILISPLGRNAVNLITGTSMTRLVPGVAILAFIGTFAQHSTGSVLWETTHGMVLRVIEADAFNAIWNAIFWVYPIERIFLVLVATIIGTAVIRALKAAGLIFIGPRGETPAKQIPQPEPLTVEPIGSVSQRD